MLVAGMDDVRRRHLSGAVSTTSCVAGESLHFPGSQSLGEMSLVPSPLCFDSDKYTKLNKLCRAEPFKKQEKLPEQELSLL